MTLKSGESKSQSFLALAFEGRTPMKALAAAILVGSALILINQYDAILGDVPFHWGKAVLTMMVPYCVATYGAVGAKRENRDGS